MHEWIGLLIGIGFIVALALYITVVARILSDGEQPVEEDGPAEKEPRAA
jgi:hypothetical protein